MLGCLACYKFIKIVDFLTISSIIEFCSIRKGNFGAMSTSKDLISVAYYQRFQLIFLTRVQEKYYREEAPPQKRRKPKLLGI